jgi:hypothetical protein
VANSIQMLTELKNCFMEYLFFIYVEWALILKIFCCNGINNAALMRRYVSAYWMPIMSVFEY